MIAAHLGIVDEGRINSMSFVFFEDVLAELGYKLHYDAVVNYAGNGFCEKSWDMIKESNPFNLNTDRGKETGVLPGLANFFASGDIQVIGGK
jgi:hypothetical protein